MDFNYEFLVFQHANHDTREKLEYYPNFIMTLLGELKALREAMCTSCQQKYASSKATRSGNRSVAISKGSTIGVRRLKLRHVIPTLPQMPKMNLFKRNRAPGSNSLPINEMIASDSISLSTKRRNESDNPIFYAELEALANPTIDITFVHSFRDRTLVFSVSFSHDEKYLAVGAGDNDFDGSISIYEVESHKKYCELREYASQYGTYKRPSDISLCFSSSGRYLAAADRVGRIIIWDVPHKRIRSIFQSHGWLSAVCFSPDERLVTFRTNAGKTVLLNMRDNSRRMASIGSCFDFSPGGRHIATGDDGVLVILDVTGKAVKRWNGHGTDLKGVKFTLDGRGLLCVYKDMIERWDVGDAVPVLIGKFDIQTHFYQACISPDHRLVAFDKQLWDTNSGNRQCILQGHNSSIISSFNFSAAGTYFAISSLDGFVSLWKYHCQT